MRKLQWIEANPSRFDSVDVQGYIIYNIYKQVSWMWLSYWSNLPMYIMQCVGTFQIHLILFKLKPIVSATQVALINNKFTEICVLIQLLFCVLFGDSLTGVGKYILGLLSHLWFSQTPKREREKKKKEEGCLSSNNPILNILMEVRSQSLAKPTDYVE